MAAGRALSQHVRAGYSVGMIADLEDSVSYGLSSGERLRRKGTEATGLRSTISVSTLVQTERRTIRCARAWKSCSAESRRIWKRCACHVAGLLQAIASPTECKAASAPMEWFVRIVTPHWRRARE